MGLFKKKPYIKTNIDYIKGGVRVDWNGRPDEVIEMGLQIIDSLLETIQGDVYNKNPKAAKILRIDMMNTLFDVYEKYGLKLIDLRGKEDE